MARRSETTATGRETRGERRGDEGEEGRRNARHEASPWERVVAALSALLVAASIAFMLYEGLAVPRSPPILEIRVDTVIEAGGSYLVRFRARNRGNETASAVVVQGELRDASGTVESSEVTLDYVPAGSEREAGLIFSRDPRALSLRLRPRGFGTP